MAFSGFIPGRAFWISSVGSSTEERVSLAMVTTTSDTEIAPASAAASAAWAAPPARTKAIRAEVPNRRARMVWLMLESPGVLQRSRRQNRGLA